ncbi:hypothetical protein GW17_00062075 [Ensete ventricosum]|nr:hypothetical protein GW17_00062075 [Ensete ventricosum]RZS29322.1 hypothetical protein BHM03_00063034 [Ensete ventricosum]
MALIDRVHDVGRVISVIDNKADGLCKEIQEWKGISGYDAVVVVEQLAFKAQSLIEHYKTTELTRAGVKRLSKSAKRGSVDLPKQVVDVYKKSTGFEMGLVRTSKVSYEYRVALARFWARYPELEIEEDPFKVLPVDSNVLMEADQPFDDSLSPPEE